MNDTVTDAVPECITPRAMHELSSDELEALLDGVRTRRLRGALMHAEALAIAKETRDEHTRESIEKQCALLQSNIDTVDKALDRMDARINKIRALRLELGLE